MKVEKLIKGSGITLILILAIYGMFFVRQGEPKTCIDDLIGNSTGNGTCFLVITDGAAGTRIPIRNDQCFTLENNCGFNNTATWKVIGCVPEILTEDGEFIGCLCDKNRII